MAGDQLASQAKDIWQQIGQHVHGSAQQKDIQQVVTELTGRVEFVAQGKTPTPTPYAALDATALARHTRAIVARISAELPVEQREKLDVMTALADRIEYAGQGSPSAAAKFSQS
jgi:hypothetical protein